MKNTGNKRFKEIAVVTLAVVVSLSTLLLALNEGRGSAETTVSASDTEQSLINEISDSEELERIVREEFAPEEEQIEPETVYYGYFEKPVVNSTGYATYYMPLKSKASKGSNTLGYVTAGEPFRILGETDMWWQVDYNGNTGYLNHDYCMINLPDVVPSIIYNITNADASIFRSSGKDLPDVTGQKLYAVGKVYNERLSRDEYICPVLYSTAKKIAHAQKKALEGGDCLKIYDSYRPRSVTQKISASLNKLYNSDSTVRHNIDYSYGSSGHKYTWGQNWFLAQAVSTHNAGSAIDVTLVKKDSGEEYEMPTAMHELSTKAIKYYSPSVSKKPSNYAYVMNDAAKKLDSYFMDTGMDTLASEWWHFQETKAYNRIMGETALGCYFQVMAIVSAPETSE